MLGISTVCACMFARRGHEAARADRGFHLAAATPDYTDQIVAGRPLSAIAIVSIVAPPIVNFHRHQRVKVAGTDSMPSVAFAMVFRSY
jgi:hypothetical protein